MNRLTYLALPLLAAAVQAQTTTFVPLAQAAADCVGYDFLPFFDTAPSPGRMMYVQDGQMFLDAGVLAAPILITQVKIRWDNELGFPDSFGGGTDPNFTLDLSTSPADYTLASATFNTNHGADRVRVFSGPLTIPAGATPGNGGPGAFDIVVTLATPFLYDATMGDLVLDFTYSGAQPSDWGTWHDESWGGTTDTDFRGAQIQEDTSATAVSGQLWNDEALCMEFTWTPAAGLYPSFSQDVKVGPSPLTVNFTDTTYTDDPAGVSVVEFDFTNDGVFDIATTGGGMVSNIYGCGTFDVAIRATDILNGQATAVVAGAVIADEVTLAIGQSKAVASVGEPINFTATAPAGSTFAWDLDGDGLVDDVAQNPTFTYTAAGNYTISCTATLSCNSTTRTSTIDIFPGIILAPAPASTFSYSTPPDGSYIDVTVTNPNGVILEQMFHRSGFTSTAHDFQLYQLNAPLTTTLNNYDVSNYTLIDTILGVNSPAVGGEPFQVDIQDIVLAPGTYGFVLVTTAGGHVVDANGAGITTSNPDLSFTPQGFTSTFSGTPSVFASEGYAGGFLYRNVDTLIPNFTADVTSGLSPLTVTFTDKSVTNDPTGVLSWAWDFQNDGTDDDFTQNPVFTYASCGDFSVKLSVIDSINGSQSITKANYIQTDLFPASFSQDATFAGTATPVNYTYTGDPAALVTWDFDSNGTTDAVGPNASFTFPAAGTYTTTMTATLNCRQSQVTSSIDIIAGDVLLAPAGSSLTGFTSPPDASYMDLQIGNLGGITITDLLFRSTNTTAVVTYEIWGQLNQSVVGNYAAANFTLLSTGTAQATTSDELFLVDVADFALPFGTHGLAVVTRSSPSSHRWWIGTSGQSSTVNNVTLTSQGYNSSFDTATSSQGSNGFAGGFVFSSGGSAPTPGTVAKLANGCANTLGVSDIQQGVNPPAIGVTYSVRITNVQAGVQLHGGISNTFNATFGVPLPLDLGPLLGAQPDCRFYPSSEAIFLAFPNAFGEAVVAFPIPNNPAFQGLIVFYQGVIFDAGVPGNIATSNAYFAVVQ